MTNPTDTMLAYEAGYADARRIHEQRILTQDQEIAALREQVRRLQDVLFTPYLYKSRSIILGPLP